MMIATLAALLLAPAAAGAAEDWYLVSAAPTWAYGIDGDSIIRRGSERAFRAASVEPDGAHGTVTMVADCSNMTIRMVEEGLNPFGPAPLVGNFAASNPVGAEVQMIERVCATTDESRGPRAKIDFPQFLRNAADLMKTPAPVRCGPNPSSRWARSVEECD
jgi:hypothetical protein